MKKVIIIGGGIIGLSIAYRLAQLDHLVVVLEKGTLCQEASTAAAGMLRAQSEEIHHNAFFQLCLESRALLKNLSDQLFQETGVAIGYSSQGTIFAADSLHNKQHLQTMYQQQQQFSLPILSLDYQSIVSLEPEINLLFNQALFFREDHSLNVLLYADALIKIAKKYGVELFEHVSVEKILQEDGKVTGVAASRGIMQADIVVICSGAWSNMFLREFVSEQKIIYPVKGHCLAVQLPEQKLHHTICSHQVYLVPCEDNKVIIGSTMEDVGFDKTVDEDIIQDLYNKAVHLVPYLKQGKIVDRWTGLRPASKDGLPILGKTPFENCFIATGHMRNGILLSPITGKIMADLIVYGKEHHLLKEFSLERFR